MGTMTEIREVNRAATKRLLVELGHDPSDVLDRRGDAVLDWDEIEGGFALEIMVRDPGGKPIIDGNDVRTRTERVTVTDERLTEYRRELWSPA